MPYEVEIKYHAPTHGDVTTRLDAVGAVAGFPIDQEDIYLAHPARDFRETHEALRLRSEGADNLITYKGPRLDGPTKTREELELPLGDGPETMSGMVRLFEILGFRRVAVVRKFRRPYLLEWNGRSLVITLDTAEELGNFVEVEAIAEGADDLPDAQAAVLDLARNLGLADDRREPRSYLRMLLERLGSE